MSFSDLARSGDGIAVTEIPNDGPIGEVFGGVIRAFKRQGFDDGYRRAISDLRTSLFAITETFLRERPELSEARRAELRHLICDLELNLVDKLQSSFTASAFVEDGLGI